MRAPEIFPGRTDIAFIDDVERRADCEGVQGIEERGLVESQNGRPWAFPGSCSAGSTSSASTTQRCGMRKQSILTVRSFARGASRIQLGEASVLVHNRSQGAGASLNAAASAHHS
jgi:hypothetical protein